MLRARRNRVYGVGPRSAHIAGLPYACFLPGADFDGATTELDRAAPGDPADYLVVRLADGRRVALTNTCAANALGLVEPGDYAYGDPSRGARRVRGRGRDAAARRRRGRPARAAGVGAGDRRSRRGRDPRAPPRTPGARRGRAAARAALGRADRGRHGTRDRRARARRGDQRDRRRALADPRRAGAHVQRADRRPTRRRSIAEVEAEAIRAGAGATTLDVRVEQIAERGAVRVTVTGAVGLDSGAVPGPATGRPRTEIAAAAAARGYDDVDAGRPVLARHACRPRQPRRGLRPLRRPRRRRRGRDARRSTARPPARSPPPSTGAPSASAR